MEESFFRSKIFLFTAILSVVVLGLFVIVQIVRSTTMSVAVQEESVVPQPAPAEVAEEPVAELPQTVRVPLPVEVRGLYWTAVTAATKRGDELLAYMKETGLNAIVLDLKMDNGQLVFTPNDATLLPYVMKKPVIEDLDALLKKLSDQQIYRIARIPVMRDSAFASLKTTASLKAGGQLWRDNTGSAWLDPAAPEVAEYALALAREAYARGFDEVQFDYVRFASDGKLKTISYPVYDRTELKVDVMRRFFAAVGGPLRTEGVPVSFDLFGLVCMANDGIGIGQRLEDVVPYADFVSPMVYPSHYANGFQGFQNPAVHPYEVIKISLDHGARLLLPALKATKEKDEVGKEITVTPTESEREAWNKEDKTIRKQFRPWIQDFDIGAVYTSAMIEAQIKAVRDAGGSGFILWNARNVYEPAKYLPE